MSRLSQILLLVILLMATPVEAGGRLRIYCTRVCPPCAALKKSLETPRVKQALVGWVYSSTTSRKEAAQAGVHAFPTVVATGWDGKELGRYEGFYGASHFSAWLNSLTSAPAASDRRRP